MHRFTSPYELTPTKAYANCPRRLVIVTEPAVFWGGSEPFWNVERIAEVMSWTDFAFVSNGTWRGLIAFCLDYYTYRLLGESHYEAWGAWARTVTRSNPWELVSWFTAAGFNAASVWSYRSGNITEALLDHDDDALEGEITCFPAEYLGDDVLMDQFWQKALREYFEGTGPEWYWHEFGTRKSLADRFADGVIEARFRPGAPPEDLIQEVIVLEPDGFDIRARAFRLPSRPYTEDELADLRLLDNI